MIQGLVNGAGIHSQKSAIACWIAGDLIGVLSEDLEADEPTEMSEWWVPRSAFLRDSEVPARSEQLFALLLVWLKDSKRPAIAQASRLPGVVQVALPLPGLAVLNVPRLVPRLPGSQPFQGGIRDDRTDAPASTALHQNHPNPFNPSTIIRYTLARPARVTLSVYDVTGRLVRELLDGPKPAGEFQVEWDGRTLRGEPASSGVYFYRMAAGDLVETRKMVLLR